MLEKNQTANHDVERRTAWRIFQLDNQTAVAAVVDCSSIAMPKSLIPMNMPYRTPKNLTELICAKPHIWTVGGTLAEVIAFISGLDYASRFAAVESETLDSESPRLLLNWLTSEFSLPGTAANSNWIPGLLSRYATEDAALAAMREFAASLPPDVDKRFLIPSRE